MCVCSVCVCGCDIKLTSTEHKPSVSFNRRMRSDVLRTDLSVEDGDFCGVAVDEFSMVELRVWT